MIVRAVVRVVVRVVVAGGENVGEEKDIGQARVYLWILVHHYLTFTAPSLASHSQYRSAVPLPTDEFLVIAPEAGSR